MINQDVQDRVDAFRGNPGALQQRYSMSQNLLDLLALQKKPVEDRLRQEKQNLAFSAYQESLKKRLTESGDLVIHQDVLAEFGKAFGAPMQ